MPGAVFEGAKVFTSDLSSWNVAKGTNFYRSAHQQPPRPRSSLLTCLARAMSCMRFTVAAFRLTHRLPSVLVTPVLL